MKATVKQRDLQELTQLVLGAVSTKPGLPILSNILINCPKDYLEMSATDLEVGVKSHIPCQAHEKGNICVPTKTFSDIVKELADKDVVLTSLKNNSISIICDKTAVKVMGVSGEDFPKLPELGEGVSLEFEQPVLKRLFELTVFAVSHDDSRPSLKGVLLVVKEQEFRVVATDGRRLAVASHRLGMGSYKDQEVIIPVKAVAELLRALKGGGKAKVYLGEKNVLVEIDGTVVTAKLVSGAFPDYMQVVPKTIKEKVTVRREALLSAIRRSSILTSAFSQAIRMDLHKGKIVVSGHAPDIGDAMDEVECDYSGEGFSTGFNPAYVMDVLKLPVWEEIVIELSEEGKPVLFRVSDDYIYVIMPMQVT